MCILRRYHMNQKHQFHHIFFVAMLANNIGNTLFAFALPLYILDLTESLMYLSIITALNTLPYLIAAIPFGYFIDHFNKLKMIICCNISSFFIYLVFTIILNINLDKSVIIYMIFLMTLMNGFIGVAMSICETSIVPELFNEESIPKANSFIFSTQYLCNTIMPIIGGIIYSQMNMSIFSLLNSVTFVFSALLLLSLKKRHRPPNQIQSIHVLNSLKKSMSSGLELIFRNKMLLLPLLSAAAINLITSNYYNDYIYLIKNILKYTTKEIGIVQSFMAIGALIGSLCVSKLYKKYGFQKLFTVVCMIMSISMIVLSQTYSIQLIIISLSIYSLVQSSANILVITNRQFSTPKDYLARADGVYKMMLLGASSLGAIIGGIKTTSLGVNLSILCSGALVLLVTFVYKQVNQ